MMVQTKEHVLALLKKNHDEIRAFGVKNLGLFSSFVRDEQHEDSDVDVLVEFEPNRKSFDSYIHLAFFLEGLFDRRVELVTSESLSPYIGPHILDEIEYVSFDTFVTYQRKLSILPSKLLD